MPLGRQPWSLEVGCRDLNLDSPTTQGNRMKKEMLINVLQPEECRIAIVEDGVLEELYVERTSQESYVGNIYKGRIVNIEPSIQAAFVDFGIGRNGFLHVSDVEPTYYRHLEPRHSENGGRRGQRGWARDQAPPASDNLADRYPEPEGVPDETTADIDGSSEGVAAEGSVAREPRRGKRSSKERGRTRGRGRRRQSDSPPEASSPVASPEVTAPEPDALFAPPEPAPEGSTEATDHLPSREASSPPAEPPQFMGSAEHRTEEREATPSALDDDIFFPRSGEAAPIAPQASEPPPQPPEDLQVREPAGEASPTEEEGGYFHGPEEPATVTPEGAPDVGGVSEWDEEHGSGFRERTYEERPRRQGRPDRRGRPDRGGRPRRHMMGRPGSMRPKPLIQDIFRRGQEVLVQVIKEGIGTKGPTLSTYISIAGRYLVLMPGLNRVGVSRKIADDEQRRRLREIFHELQPPKGLGFIIRTAGIDKTKKELQRDLAYLSRLWQVVVRRIRKLKAPAEIYKESDMITRTIRDTFTSDINTIWVDEPAAFEHAQEFMQIVMPRYANRIQLYNDSEPLFHKYGIENEIARIQQRHVPLPHGGSIVIDQTEALVAIDVNSGNFRADNNAEETAYRMNLQAAKEIARQLRLRDLGGVIVNDFIDMRDEKHRRDVERALRDAVKRDRARTKILRISAFGLIEMTRQRIRPSLKRSVYQDCPYCGGSSQVKTCESMSIDVMRMLQLAAHRENIHRIAVRVQEDVANYLQNRKRAEISRLEQAGNIQVMISSAVGVSPETLEFVCYDNNNNEVKFMPYEEGRQRRH
jgi:Rne/Rng family ribonuclease